MTERGKEGMRELLFMAGRKTRTYGRMIKFEHSIFALPLALAALLLALRQSPVSLQKSLLIVVAMVGARSAAMGFNRIADATIDRKNPRTSVRELPSGRMTVKEAAIFVGASCLLFVLAALFISWTCFWCSFAVLVILLGYSFTKRFTWLCHIVLGFTIGLAPLGVWVAITGRLSWRIGLLSLALSTYIAGFDILYACQDIEFDRQEDLHSLPARFGVGTAMRVSSLLHFICFGALLSLYRVFSLSPVYFGFLIVIGVLLVIEHRLISPRDLSKIHIAFFHVNSIISVMLFAALLVEELMRHFT